MKQRGIALLQVLLIASILSTLALFLTQTAQQQVYIATQFNNKAEALVKNYDLEANVLFGLLTEKKDFHSTLGNGVRENIYLQNFHGDEFQVSKEQYIRLQDLRGLLSIHFPNESRWLKVLQHTGTSEYNAMNFFRKTQDWQDVNTVSSYNLQEKSFKNGPIQSLNEWEHLEYTAEQKKLLTKVATIYKGSTFNPITAPSALIKALYSKVVSEQILTNRERNLLSPSLFTSITGELEQSKVYFYPSNDYKIELKTEVGAAKVKRVLYYQLNPRKASPVNLMATEG